MSQPPNSAELAYSFHLIPLNQARHPIHMQIDGSLGTYPAIKMNVQLYYYIMDTLEWIPTDGGLFSNVPFDRPIITSAGASIAERIFRAWAALFALGPEQLSLTGLYTISSGSSIGSYQTVHCARDTIVTMFSQLAAFADIAKRGCHVIYWSDLIDYHSGE